MSRMIALTIGPLDVDPADDGRCLIRFFVASNFVQTFIISSRVFYIEI